MATEPIHTLAQYMEFASANIHAALDQWTQPKIGCPTVLEEAMRYVLLAPSKLLRPLLVFMASDACGQRSSATLANACAVEMIHTYSLIHDDLPAMDDDQLRRGQATCHVKFGEANAILAGDALLALAFQVVASSESPAEIRAASCQALATAAGPCQLVGGQVDHLAAEHQAGDLDLLRQIHHRKTGAMFRVSLRLGAIAATANDEQIDHLDAYGKLLGLAFQVVDDLLDCEGDQQQLGKQTGKDSEHGKLTYPSLMGIAASREYAEELIQQAQAELTVFGESANWLRQLAEIVLSRTN